MGAILYQEWDGKDRVIACASRALSKSKYCYPAHNLEFLALKWAVTESFQEYLYGNIFTMYSDTLSRIPWDQNIRANVVKAISTMEGPDALMEIYACHEKAISSLIFECPPVQMTIAGWDQAQKVDPTINQVVTWIKSEKFDTVKVGYEISQEQKQYQGQLRKLCLWEGVLYWHDNWAGWDQNELQLVVLQEYRPEAMHGAHSDESHLGCEQMLDILLDWFYWPNPEDDTTWYIWTCECCLRFKGRQDKESSTCC